VCNQLGLLHCILCVISGSARLGDRACGTNDAAAYEER
jgi:hypothetical protein